jgi:ferritin
MKDTVQYPRKKEKIPTSEGIKAVPKKFPKPHNHLTHTKKKEKRKKETHHTVAH